MLKHVSNFGRVQNVGKAQNRRKFSPCASADGYCYLNCKGIGRVVIHPIVNVLFNDPALEHWKDGLTTDHRDKCRSNNRFDNLVWATMKEQRQNQNRLFGHVGSAGGKFAQPVWLKFPDSDWKHFVSLRAASNATSLSFSRLRDIVSGKTKKNRIGIQIQYAELVEEQQIAGEVWKKIPNTNGFVSSIGRIQSTPHSKRYTPEVKSGRRWAKINPLCVKQVGHLMLLAFDRPPADGESCDHIDGDPLNNKLENLRWLDQKGQISNQRKKKRKVHERLYEVQRFGEDQWNTVTVDAARNHYGIDSTSLSHVADPTTPRQSTQSSNGVWYRVRYAADGDECDFEGEIWKDFIVEDWVKGGKYACVRNAGRGLE